MFEYDVTPVWDNGLDHDLHHLEDNYFEIDVEYGSMYDFPEYGSESIAWETGEDFDY